MPLGFRQGAVAVRNAELQLCRARAILEEQEHLVLHDAAAAVAEFDRASTVAQTTARRLDAAREQADAVRAAFDADKVPLDLMLEAQRRLADAESRHFQSLAEYAIAIKNVHYVKGTLLDYDGVVLSESGWPAKAYADAAERDSLRGKPRPLNYRSIREPLASAGPYAQRAADAVLAQPIEVIEGAPIEAEPIEPPPADDSIPTAPSPPPAPTPVDPAVHQELVNPVEQSATAGTAAVSANLAAALDAAASH